MSGPAPKEPYDLVAKMHAEEISAGLGVVAEAIREDVVVSLRDSFLSSVERDSDGDKANVVDGLFAVARAIEPLAAVVRDK